MKLEEPNAAYRRAPCPVREARQSGKNIIDDKCFELQ
jgi:hypothetical protein